MIVACRTVAALFAGLSACIAPVRAQDEVIAVKAAHIVITAEEFDQLVLGGTAEAAKMTARCTAALAHEIETLDRVCSLSDFQKRKLQLAGRGDIKSFFDRANDLRTEYVGVPLTPQKHRQVAVEIHKLRTTNRWDLFHDESLFRKMMRKILTDTQVGLIVEWVVAEWDLRVRGIDLAPENRRKLAELLRAKSQPPLAWSHYTYHVVTLQFAELEDDVQPLVAQAEWSVFQHQFAEARKLEPKLRELGAWPVRSPAELDDATEG
jgi:hypothetical protein